MPLLRPEGGLALTLTRWQEAQVLKALFPKLKGVGYCMVADRDFGVHNAPVALVRTTTAIVHLEFSGASPNKDSGFADSSALAGGSLRCARGSEEEGGLCSFQPCSP